MANDTNKIRQQAIKAAIDGVKATGVPGFVVGFELDGLVTTHFENMPMASVARIVIALFNQMCDYEAAQGHMSKEYRQAMVDLKNEFHSLIKAHNARFELIKKAGKPGTKTA